MGIPINGTPTLFTLHHLLFTLAIRQDFYPLSNIVFTTPLSINAPNIFFNIISTIGPTSIPITPINLNPVYIAIRVNIGCIPI